MKKTKTTGVATQITRLKKPYEGGDTLMDWHKEKMKSSVAETYKNADYATALWRCENDWDRTKQYLVGIAMWVFLLFSLYSLACWFEGLVP
jgi:hypothetical protein